MNMSGPHWPTFLWAVVAIFLALIVYSMLFGGK